jgi:hypothetical protein
MSNFKSVFYTIFYYFLGVITSVILLLFVFIPVVVPLLLLRGFAILTAKCIQSLGRPLSLSSVAFTGDDLYGKPGMALTVTLGYDGPLNKSQVEKRYKDTMESQFPELKQFLSWWMGFYFWEQDPNFSFDDHFTYCEEEIKCMEDLDERRHAMSGKPFRKRKPLWNVVVFPNCKIEGSDVKTATILRIHHTMADGYSILQLTNALTDNKNLFENMPKPNVPNRDVFGLVWITLRLCLRGPIDVLIASWKSFMETNEWRNTSNKMKGEGHLAAVDVPLSYVKEIGTKHGVRTTAVIFAALAGGIRRYMEISGTQIPKRFTVISPLPLPNHPNYLTNFA